MGQDRIPDDQSIRVGTASLDEALTKRHRRNARGLWKLVGAVGGVSGLYSSTRDVDFKGVSE